MFRGILIGLVRFWQVAFSSWMPPTCRYTPSCSAYAIEAIRAYGAGRGGWLALRRVLRCHPWGGHGHDPVPLPAARHEGQVEKVLDEFDATPTRGSQRRPTSSAQ